MKLLIFRIGSGYNYRWNGAKFVMCKVYVIGGMTQQCLHLLLLVCLALVVAFIVTLIRVLQDLKVCDLDVVLPHRFKLLMPVEERPIAADPNITLRLFRV